VADLKVIGKIAFYNKKMANNLQTKIDFKNCIKMALKYTYRYSDAHKTPTKEKKTKKTS